MTRKIDSLGRICLPKEWRTALGIGDRDYIDMELSGKSVVLSKHQDLCCICGESGKDCLELTNGKVCSACLRDIERAKKASY